MTDLYDDDILTWSQRQAELLRQHAATARTESCGLASTAALRPEQRALKGKR
jgi:hypothetical protein